MDLCAHSVSVCVGGPARCACQRCLVPCTWRGNQNGYRCSSSALPISGWRFCGGLSDRYCSCGVLLSVSSRSWGCSRLVAVQYFLKGADWTEFSARAGDSALPGLLHLHCRVICTSTVFWSLHLHCQLIFTSTVFWSCQIKTVYFHSQLDLELLFRNNRFHATPNWCSHLC